MEKTSVKIIKKSAEHHFLTSVESIKNAAANWGVLILEGVPGLNHANLVKDLPSLGNKLSKAQQKSSAYLKELEEMCAEMKGTVLYQFSNYDLGGLFYLKTEDDRRRFDNIYKLCSTNKVFNKCYSLAAGRDMRFLQKLVDQKFLEEKRFQAYQAMQEKSKVKSIGSRRARREDPSILLVEDDRFTASYTSNILSKDYDLISCRTGEEGVMAYIDHAPDVVFLDIHLPGLNGHDTLKAIYAVDPEAYVIMLSVDTVKDNITQSLQDGARLFLKKPFSRERLQRTVMNSPYVRGGGAFSPVDSQQIH